MMSASVFSEVPDIDSLHIHHLDEVNVNGQALKIVRSSLPLQLFNETEINNLNASTITDVAKHFAGVTVKDYGGIGGLKTVSLRGLGALQTGVSYDGLMMSDIQTGQVDLGQFSIENIAEISLSNGQLSDIFQPSRMFASSGLISFSSKMPEYKPEHSFSGEVVAKVGSLGLINPTINLFDNISKKWGIGLITNGLSANGEYKFAESLNNSGTNQTEKTRINSDIKSLRTELNSIYRITSVEFITLKANQYYSERGLPGPDILYSTFSTDRMLDKDYFAQLHYENKNSNLFQYQISGKANSAFMEFSEVNPAYQDISDNKRIDNYLQHEYYLTSTVQFHPASNLSVSTSVDWIYNHLETHSNSGLSVDASPIRNTVLANLAVKYVTDQLTIAANALYTGTRETTQNGNAAPNRDKISPTLSFSYKLLSEKELRIRSFYKNIFRLPTFSELYFHDLGYVNLLPEITNQFNLGLVYREPYISLFSDIEISLDGYYNLVSDKITILYGMPYSSIRNIGSVEIKGCDATLKFDIPLRNNNKLKFSGNYTFQLAQNKTIGSANLGEQIPYTPFNSGSGSISYLCKKFEGGYNLLFAGKRWNGQNISNNLLKPYIEHSLFAKFKFNKFKLTSEIINLFDSQYEIIKNYPMQGRNYRLTASISL